MQQTDFVEIDVDYHYTGGVYDNLEDLAQNTLAYQAYFQSMEWTKEELDYISKQLVETGKIFAINQGFGPGRAAPGYNSTPWGRSHFPTGTLYHSIKAEVNGNSINFYNDAKNFRGQPYAGHLEYGFHDRGGNFIQARPFMRPAFYAVAEGSKGNFQHIMKGLLEDIWTVQGFRGLNRTMEFGMRQGSRSLFWKQNGEFGSKLSQRSRMGELRQTNGLHRMRMSANRNVGPNRKSGSGYTGYRFSKNQKDFGMKGTERRQLKAFEQDMKSKESKKTVSSYKPMTGQKLTQKFTEDRRSNTLYKNGIQREPKVNGMTKKEFVEMYKTAGFTTEEAEERFNSHL